MENHTIGDILKMEKVTIRQQFPGMKDETTEREFGSLIKQLEYVFNDDKVVNTKVFYTSPTSGGLATTKNTLTFNKYNALLNWKVELNAD